MPSRPVRRLAHGGFTLLEMLVVLVLTGLVGTLLFQATQQVFRLETRFGREAFAAGEGEMVTEWFRQSVNGLVPARAGGGNRFAGTQREFSGITIAPLDVATSALQPFSWRLRFDPASGETQLRYGRDDAAPAVMTWRGNTGRFVYHDAGGEAHGAWPPGPGAWPQLPRAIFLETQDVAGPRVVVAVPRGRDDPLPPQRDAIE